MNIQSPIILVIGAGGFVGRTLVHHLVQQGYCVRAIVHQWNDLYLFDGMKNVSTIKGDILDFQFLDEVMKGVDVVLHFAALVDPTRSSAELHQVNVEGTRHVWTSAAAHGVKRAIFCSSIAVYGLLRRKNGMIDESSPANAVEPYGRTKFLAEREVLLIGSKTGLHTTIIRPAAIFGPGEHTPFGKKLRDAAVSKLLFAGGFQNKRFTFVHVDDVSEATIHLMKAAIPSGEIFNVVAEEPISFYDAFDAYIRALRRAGRAYARVKFLALVSRLLHRVPTVAYIISIILGNRFIFKIWKPGFDQLYSSAKLRATSFMPKWNNFEEVFYSCLKENEIQNNQINRILDCRR